MGRPEITYFDLRGPRIAAYRASPRRPAAIQYGPAGKIYPVET